MGRRILTGFAVAAGLIVVILALLWLLQRRLIYIPVTQAVPPVEQLLPGAREVSFPTEDGLTLSGWLMPAAAAPVTATILVFNGNAGNRAFRTGLAAGLSQVGFNVLLFDYRGYGGNPGWPSETGLLADARAARSFLDSLPEANGLPIVYFGESLGAGVAVQLAAVRPPAVLILRSPFTSLADAARAHYPFLPVRPLLVDHYPSLSIIPGLSCPLLVLAGDADRIVPLSQSRTLFEAAVSPKKLVVFPGIGHNDAEFLDGKRMLAAVVDFVAGAVQTDG